MRRKTNRRSYVELDKVTRQWTSIWGMAKGVGAGMLELPGGDVSKSLGNCSYGAGIHCCLFSLASQSVLFRESKIFRRKPDYPSRSSVLPESIFRSTLIASWKKKSIFSFFLVSIEFSKSFSINYDKFRYVSGSLAYRRSRGNNRGSVRIKTSHPPPLNVCRSGGRLAYTHSRQELEYLCIQIPALIEWGVCWLF